MKKIVIPDQILKELGDELSHVTGADVIYASQKIMCIQGGDKTLPFEVLQKAKDMFGDILKDYNILWMSNASPEKAVSNPKECAIVFNGEHIMTIWLVRYFGGVTSGHNLWLVYNHSYIGTHYGYKGENLPDARSIISFVEHETK